MTPTKTVEPQASTATEPAEEKHFLTRAEIIAANDVQTEELYVPLWGGWLMLRNLTGTERDAYESSMLSGQVGDRTVNTENLRSKLVAKSCVDPKTLIRIFSDDDILVLGRKSAAVLQQVFEVCQRLSALTDKDVEKLTNELGKGQSDGSGTA